jgi:hypothetical protein
MPFMLKRQFGRVGASAGKLLPFSCPDADAMPVVMVQ